MYSRYILTVCLQLLILLTVCEAQRLAIDKRSCKESDKDQDNIYAHARAAVERAIKWSGETADAIGKPLAQMEPRIRDKVSMLLGEDQAKIDKAADGFRQIGSINIVDWDVFDKSWKIVQTDTDIALVCNLDYVEEKNSPPFPDYAYKDLIRDLWIPSNHEVVTIKKQSTSDVEMAVHKPFAKPGKDKTLCDVMFTTPYAVESFKKRNWPSLTEDRIRKAANPSIWSRFDDAAENMSQQFFSLFGEQRHLQASVSLIDTWERVIIHEFTHTRQAHRSEDKPDKKCYGWLNAVKCREPENADSLAWLAISIQLIKNFGYDVTKKGELVKIG